MDRRLAEVYHLTLPQIDAMTMPEIAVLLMRADDQGPAGGVAMTDDEVEAEIRRWQSMTPAQRLEDARRKRDG